MKEPKIFSVENLTEKVHYVYRVTIDEKYYIGKRTGFLNDLHTGAYKTSSELVQEKLRNGHRFSKIKILQVFSSSKDALEFEKRILMRVNARKNPKFLNQHNGNGEFSLRQHTEKTKKKISKKAKEFYKTERGKKQREIQTEFMKEFYNPNTEEGRRNLEINSKMRIEFYKTERGVKNKEIHSEFMTERFNPNTEEGRKNRENHSEFMKEYYNTDTEEGRKRRENKTQLAQTQFDPKTEEGRRNREKHSEIMKKAFNPNTEEGRRNRENMSKSHKEFYNTEQGKKLRENHSEFMKEFYNTEQGKKQREIQSEFQRNNWNKNTERGRKLREHLSEKGIERFNPETEEGRIRREDMSNKKKEYFNPETEEGRIRREDMSNKRKEQTKEQLQKRKNSSILGELMFDEDFLRENFLILDNKNNPRFLWSVYSKLTGYKKSSIIEQKREGKLSFLHGIESISISEELENSKIKEIEAIIKSRNDEKE